MNGQPRKWWDLTIGRTYKGSDGQDKTNWTRLGRMTYNAEKESFTIFLDALPAHGENIMAFKPKPKDPATAPAATGAQPDPTPPGQEGVQPDPSTDIPF